MLTCLFTVDVFGLFSAGYRTVDRFTAASACIEYICLVAAMYSPR